MEIFNKREGFATNSSSTHSVISCAMVRKFNPPKQIPYYMNEDDEMVVPDFKWRKKGFDRDEAPCSWWDDEEEEYDGECDDDDTYRYFTDYEGNWPLQDEYDGYDGDSYWPTFQENLESGEDRDGNYQVTQYGDDLFYYKTKKNIWVFNCMPRPEDLENLE
jgi:hypothetical protein